MKTRSRKRLVALLLSGLMLLTLFQNVAYNPFAEGGNGNPGVEESATVTDANEATSETAVTEQAVEDAQSEKQDAAPAIILDLEESVQTVFANAPLDFRTIIKEVTVNAPASGLGMNESFKMNLKFALPEDGDTTTYSGITFDIANYSVFEFDLNQVSVKSDSEDVNALVSSATITDPQPIYMNSNYVGKYTIIDGKVTLDFSEGVDSLKDSTISREGNFTFSCSLDADKLDDKGGDYKILFATDSTVQNPTVKVNPKDYLNPGVEVDKVAGTIGDDGTISYTIKVSNKGTQAVSDITLNDEMGTYLSYVGTVGATNGVTVTPNGQNLSVAVPTVPAGGDVTFTYKCQIADEAYVKANDAQNGKGDNLGNRVSATIGTGSDKKNIYVGPNKETNKNVNTTVKKDLVNKSCGGSVSPSNTVTWTIVVNAGETPFDLDGYTFKDTPDALLGTPTNINVTGGTAELQNALKFAIENGSPYVFPAGSKGTYTITYETALPANVQGLTSYKNDVEVGKDGLKDTASATTPKTGEAISSKAFDGSLGSATINNQNYDHVPMGADNKPLELATTGDGDYIIPWKTNVKVPEGSTSFVYVDEVQSWYGENHVGFSPSNEAAEFTIVTSDGTTLVKGDDFTVAYSNNGSMAETITATPTGLAKLQGKTVTISYKTIGKKNPDNAADHTYTNNYKVTVGTIEESGKAFITYLNEEPESPDSYITKSVSESNEKDHTITWCVEVTIPDGAELKDLKLEDEIASMKYCGYDSSDENSFPSYTDENAPRALIIASDYQKYSIAMSQSKTDKVDPESGLTVPVYTYTMDFTNALNNVQVWDQSKALKNSDGNLQRSFKIYYKTKVDGPLTKFNNKTMYSNSIKGTGTFNDDPNPTTDTASAKKELITDVLKKDCVHYTTDGAARLQYTLAVNPDQLKLNPDDTQNFFVIEDTLPASQIYEPALTNIKGDGVALTLASSADEAKTNPNKYFISYNNNVITFIVPDGKRLDITYKVTILSDAEAGTQTYINAVKIAQPYVSEESYVRNESHQQVFTSSATIIGAKLFRTEKIDAIDVLKHLKDAEFQAVEYVYNPASYSWQESGYVFKGKTDANGFLDAGAFACTTDVSKVISVNKIYKISEINAPTGYDKTDKTYKVIVLNKEADDHSYVAGMEYAIPNDTYRITAGTTLLFTDMPNDEKPENSLKITKKYYEADGTTAVTTAPATNAVLDIYHGNYTLAQCQAGMYTPLATGADLGDGFSYTKSGNVIQMKKIPAGTYTVFEKSAPNGYDILTKVYHFTVDADTAEITWENQAADKALDIEEEIKNTKTFENTLTINKKYYEAEDASKANPLTNPPVDAVFTYRQIAYYDVATASYVNTNGTTKNMSKIDSFTYKVEDLSAGKYEIRENDSAIYTEDAKLPITVTVAPDGKITWTATNGGGANQGTIDCVIDADNTIVDNKITLKKTYYKADGTQVDAATLPTADQKKVIFTLNYNATSASNYAPYTPATVTPVTVNKADEYSWENLKPGYYQAVESLATGDNTKYETMHTVTFQVKSDYTIAVTGKNGSAYTQSVDVANRELGLQDAARFYLEKYLADQSGLNTKLTDTSSGVGFQLVKTGVATPITFDYNSTRGRWEAFDLDAGTYTITETSVATGFKQAGKITFEVVDDTANSTCVVKNVSYSGASADFSTATLPDQDGVDTVVAKLINRPEENKITVTKKYLDAAGNDITASFTTTKAEFTLYKNGVEVERLEGNASNTYTFTKLDIGSYKIVETKVPTGYTKCDDIAFTVGSADSTTDYSIHVIAPTQTSQYVITSGDGTYNVAVEAKNTVTNKFSFVKQYTHIDGSTVTLSDATGSEYASLKAGTSFTVTGTANAPVYDGNGVWSLSDIADGTYVISENAPDGYTAAANITLTVSQGKISAVYAGNVAEFTGLQGNNTTNVSANLINRQSTNSVTVVKEYYEADGTTLIPNNQVTSYAAFTLTKADGSPVTGVTTNISQTNGTYRFNNLVPGTYKITETKPTGFEYEIIETPIQFSVDANGKITFAAPAPTGWTIGTDGAVNATVTAKNTRPENRIRLTKSYFDAAGNEIQPADVPTKASFVLKDSLGNSTPVVLASGESYYVIENLKTGTYTLSEDSLAGYKSLTGEITINVATDGKMTATYSGSSNEFGVSGMNTLKDCMIVLKNYQVSNQIVIHKSYKTYAGVALTTTGTNPGVPAAELATFRLYKNYGTATQSEITGAKVSVDKTAGVYSFSNLDEGAYTIVETPGGNFNKIDDITFDVNSARQIENVVGATPNASSDASNKYFDLVNTRKPFENKITLDKKFMNQGGQLETGSNYTSLFNQVEFKMYQNNTQITSFAKVNGVWTAENLEPGTYVIRETSYPAEYVPAGDIRVIVTKTSATDTVVTATYLGNLQDDMTATSSNNFKNLEIELINHQQVANKLTLIKEYVDVYGNVITGADKTANLANTVFEIAPANGGQGTPIVLDQNGEAEITDLATGTYVITETAPIGFTAIGDVEIVVANDGKITVNYSGDSEDIRVTKGNGTDDRDIYLRAYNYTPDQFVNIGKKELAGSNELEGAKLEIRDKATGNTVIDSWISGTSVHKMVVSKFTPDVEYILKETTAPFGYDLAEEITFKLDENGKVLVLKDGTFKEADNNTFFMEDAAKYVQISKKDATTKDELPGATLVITDKDGKTVVEPWKSTDTNKSIKMTTFKPNTEYKLTETTAPFGYDIAETIIFKIDETGKIYVKNEDDKEFTNPKDGIVVMEDAVKKIAVSKLDLTNGKELPGAKLTIKDKDGNVIDTWTSTTDKHEIEVKKFKVNEEYTLTEVTAPFGYEIAETITFKFDTTGNILVLQKDGTFKNLDSKLVMEDAVKKVSVSKVDITNGKELPGAKLTIKDKDGNVIDTWTSTDEKHEIDMNKFKPNVEYTLTEVTAPNGYEVAETITFVIDENGEIYVKNPKSGAFEKLTSGTLVMQDQPTATNTSTKTGDSTPVSTVFLLSILSFAGIFMLRRMRKEEEA